MSRLVKVMYQGAYNILCRNHQFRIILQIVTAWFYLTFGENFNSNLRSFVGLLDILHFIGNFLSKSCTDFGVLLISVTLLLNFFVSLQGVQFYSQWKTVTSLWREGDSTDKKAEVSFPKMGWIKDNKCSVSSRFGLQA